MRIISWNINSVRLRIGLVEKLLKQEKPDILCLQETKCPNDSFPEKNFTKLGYPHIAKNGIKGYHGVATISRVPLLRQKAVTFCGREDGRHMETVYDFNGDELSVHNFYVPAGGDEPDRQINEKFGHKLDFLAEMEAMFKRAKNKKTAKKVLLGDLNIAPYEHDVWSSKQLKNVVSHTAIEREKLAEVLAAFNWEDVARRFVPEEEKLYSWWSYRARDWLSSNRGRRLDHIWASPGLSPHVTSYRVRAEARGWDRPSDHAPVVIDLK
ncbi:MAG: exodeoxyribonuclease III [Parvibaculales bacterium]